MSLDLAREFCHLFKSTGELLPSDLEAQTGSLLPHLASSAALSRRRATSSILAVFRRLDQEEAHDFQGRRTSCLHRRPLPPRAPHGLDIGTKTIGLALSDVEQRIVSRSTR